MIAVTITRDELVRHDACDTGLALFERIAPSGRLEIAEWTALHAVWLAAAEPSHCGWLTSAGIIPRANLACAYLVGADLSGAHLGRADLARADLACANLGGEPVRCTRCRRDATPPFRLCSECREDHAARRRAAAREARAVAVHGPFLDFFGGHVDYF